MEDLKSLGLPLEVVSEDGNTYTMLPMEASPENIDFLWETAGQYKFLFSDDTFKDKDHFVRYILSPAVTILTLFVHGEESNESIGVLYIDRVALGQSARMHYLFWDRIQKGRHRVLLTFIKWAFTEFELHRIHIEIPKHAYAALRRMHRMGVRLEGILREAFVYNSRWTDLYIFGVLESEITSYDTEKVKLHRTRTEDSWFGLLDNDTALAHAVLKER